MTSSKSSKKREKKKKTEEAREQVKPNTRTIHVDALGPSLPPLNILYTCSFEAVQDWMEIHASCVGSLEDEHVSFLGFDTETKPCFTREASVASRGPDTIQFAKADGNCLVAHISQMRSEEEDDDVARKNKNDILVAAFQVLNDDIVKAGVAIDQDAFELYKNYGLHTKCRLELGNMCLDLETFVNSLVSRKSLRGLQKLCEEYMPEMSMPKSKKLQMSNWSIALSDAQIEYAAVDAFAGAILCQLLMHTFTNSSRHDLKDILRQHEVAIEELEEERLRRKREKRRLIRLRKTEAKKSSEVATTAAEQHH